MTRSRGGFVDIPVLALASIALAVGLASPAFAGEDRARPTVTIGVMFDAPADDLVEDGSDITYLGVLDRIVEETVALTRREFDVRFPKDKRRYGGWTADGIHAAIDDLLADPEVDVVLAMGAFASADVVTRDALPKPVVAPFVVDVDPEHTPRDGDRSGIPNLSYVTLPLSIDDQIARFREIVGFDRVHFVFDELALDILPSLPERTLAIAARQGVDGVGVPLGTSAEDAASRIPDDAEAVFLFPLPRFTAAQDRRLLEIINAKRIPSLSYLFDDLLDEGALLALAPMEDLDRLTRRVAINLQRILLGEEAGTLPVVLEQDERLTINMDTARSIGWYPTWDVMMRADLLHEERDDAEQLWTLDEVAREVVLVNLDLRVRAHELEASAQDVREARAGLLPQLDLAARGTVIDNDRAAASLGQQAARSLVGTARLSQVLWSHRASGNLDVQQALQASREQDYDAAVLDVVLDATTAFLDVLRARTAVRIRRENVRLTEDNLRVAERRRELGASGPAEVYRWRSRLATDRQEAIAAWQQLEIARAVLNRLLNRSLEEPFLAETPDLLDPDLVTGEGRLRPYIDDPGSFAVFREFMVRDGLSRSPELRRLDAAIDARRAARTIARRSFWSPEIGLFGEVAQLLDEDGVGSSSPATIPGFSPANDTDWSFGVQMTLPLVTGGARRADLVRNDRLLRGLELQRADVRDRLELRIRTALFRVASSSTAIDLSAEAADAARQNLDLVRDSYSQGVVTFLELLDAQNAAVVADQVASNAVFDFLIDLMELQRATVNYDFFRSADERDAWFERLREFFRTAGMTPDASEG